MVNSHSLVLYLIEYTTNSTMVAFEVGMKFEDFKSLESQMDQFQKENFVKLSKN